MQDAVLTFAEIISGARIIPLSNGKLCFVDAEDFEEIISYRWNFSNGYAIRNSAKNGRHTTFRLHRQLLMATASQEVDHKNRNKLDNRRFNLRFADRTGACQNRGRQKNNTSGFKGVSFHVKTGRWQAQITILKKKTYLGIFLSKEDAYRAFCKAAKLHHGEFACLK